MDTKECDMFVTNFMNKMRKKNAKLINGDYDQIYGSLFTQLMLALPKFREDNPKKAKLSSFLYGVCLNELNRYRKKERSYYNHNFTRNDLHLFRSKDNTPLYNTLKEELISQINKSNLPTKTREIILLYIEDPYSSGADLAARCGVTRQAINNHIQSARQYLKNKRIEMDLV